MLLCFLSYLFLFFAAVLLRTAFDSFLLIYTDSVLPQQYRLELVRESSCAKARARRPYPSILAQAVSRLSSFCRLMRSLPSITRLYSYMSSIPGFGLVLFILPYAYFSRFPYVNNYVIFIICMSFLCAAVI